MNTTSKALSLSLAFHSLMALFAALMFNMFHNSSIKEFAIPIKHMTLVALYDTAPLITPPSQTLQPRISKPVVTPPQQAISKVIHGTLPPAPQSSVTPVSETTAVAAEPAVSRTENKPAPASASVPAPIPSPAKASAKININAEKQSFFAGLRSKIQQNLRYPSAARRRGMEGEVNVRFTLENGGVIRDVAVFEGESIFHEAAKHAVASASGIKIPEVLTDTLPTEIQLTLEFRLN